jgi:hypothetical protein
MTAGRVTATTEDVRRSLYEQRAHTLAETVYLVLGVPTAPDHGAEFLAALAQAVKSVPLTTAILHATPAQASLDRLVDALNQGAAPDTLTSQALRRVSMRDGWTFDEKPDWPYGASIQRLMLIETLWRAAQRDATSKPVVARREARAAILLCAQDYSEVGPATLIGLMRSTDAGKLMGMSPEAEGTLREYLSGHQRASRIFFRVYLDAVDRYPSIFADSNLGAKRAAFLELLRPLAAVSIHRPELQFHLASLTGAADELLRRTNGASQFTEGPLEHGLQPIVGSELFDRWVSEAQAAGVSKHTLFSNGRTQPTPQ